MISFPYDNQSETVQDRNIDSDTYAKYMDRMVGTNGIFLELGTKLEVTAGEGMTVLVKPGDGIITGHFFIEEDTRELQVQSSESLDRIDTVVLRHDAEKRMIDLYVVKGTSATVPQPPELTREGGIYELGIANIYVPKLTDTIAQERITDTRLNTERCGVAPVLGGIDTQGLYDQYQASLDAFLELVNTAIDGTTAGHLQNQIDEIDSKAVYVIEEGEKTSNYFVDGLKYKKFSNGELKAQGIFTSAFGNGEAFGTLFFLKSKNPIPHDIGFVSPPNIIATTYGSVLAMPCGTYSNTKDSTGLYIVVASQTANQKISFAVEITGFWK